MIWYSLILAIIPFSCLFIPYFSMQIDNLDGVVDCSDYSIDIQLYLPIIVWKQWKLKMGYYEEQSAERYVELKMQELFAVCISCRFCTAYHRDSSCDCGYSFAKVMGISCLIGAASGYIFLLVAIWTDRQPVQVISSNSDININYTRAKKESGKHVAVQSG